MEKIKASLKTGIKHIVSNPLYVSLFVLLIVLWGVMSAATPPNAPTNLVLDINQASSTSLTLTWQDNSNNEDRFEIQQQEVGGPWTATLYNYYSTVVSPNINTYTHLSPAVTVNYEYRVRACLSVDCSAWSTLSAIHLGIPESPSGLSLDTANTTTSSIALTWTDNSTNENKFNIFRKLSSLPDDSANWNFLNQIPTANVVSYNDSISNNPSFPPVAGVLYDYKVEACLSSNGCSVPSNTLIGVSTVPLAPTNLLTGTITSSLVPLSWTDNSNNETQFLIQNKLSTDTVWSDVATVTSGINSYDDTSVRAGTTYDYRVQACNSNNLCSTYATLSNVMTSTAVLPIIPSDPTSFSYKKVTSNSVTLIWVDNSDNENQFNIERKLSNASSDPWLEIQIMGQDITTYTDDSVKAGETYDYRIKACTSGGTNCSPYVLLTKVVIPRSTTSSGSGGGSVTTTTPPPTSAVIPPVIVDTINTPPVTTTTIPVTKVNLPIIKPTPTETTLTIETPKASDIVSPKEEATSVPIDISKEDINQIIDIISGPKDDQNIKTESQTTDLIYKDTNNDGVSDYDSVYVYNIDPVKPSPVSTYNGESINAGDKILLGFDPTKVELTQIQIEQPVNSSASVVSSYKVSEITLNEEKKIVLSGQALPNSFITLYIYSTPIMVTIKTSNNGEWQYVLDKELENGKHTIYAATVNNSGNIVAKSSGYVFTKTAEAVTLNDLPISSTSNMATKPGLLEGLNLYIFISGFLLIVFIVLIIAGIISKKNANQN